MRRDDPIGLGVEDDVARAGIEASDDNHLTNLRISTARTVVPGANVLAFASPIAVVAHHSSVLCFDGRRKFLIFCGQNILYS